ncbi:hypothetical protein SteCoe_19231 [Stentor coeruleus]|uniref:Uncharacterized protein n=1 Tax=Stentor coeruleus TaxID=5963 RepID=A0A1R2BUI3_9CILI|nr:hypothetical protein SteCoe_19231 [Stentor coeruleus]
MKIIEFFDDFSSIKTKDINFCETLGKLIYQLQDKKLKLSQLKSLTASTVTNCDKLIRKYRFLIKAYPQASEIKKLYGSLLTNILGDPISGEHYLTESLNFVYNDTQYMNPFSFHQRRCFFIVSCAIDSFGKIIQCNNNFLKFLSITPEIAQELYIDNLIVPNFCNDPFKTIKKFIGETITHKVINNSGLPLLSHEGFLLEGIVNSELVSYKTNLNFVCSFDPLISKKREVALLNKYGVILGHSKGFAKYFVIETNKIIGETFSNFVYENIENNMIEDKIFPLSPKANGFNKKDLFGVLKKKKIIGNIEMTLLYLTNSDDELLSWKNNFEDFYKENDIDSIFKLASEVILSKTNLMSSEQGNNDTTQLLMGASYISKCNREKSIDSLKPDLQGITEVEIKSLKKAVFVLSMTKLVLFISVISIQILVMIISSIASLSYISLEVKHSNSLKPMINLGDIGYLVSGVSFILRYLDASIHGNYTAYYTYDNVNTLLSLLKERKNVLSDEYSEWSYCPSSRIIKEKIIPYWVYEKKPILRYSNLPNLLDLFLTSSYSIVNEMQEGKNNYTDHLFFVVFISMGNSFDIIYDAMVNLEKCELSRIDNLKDMSQYLLFASLAVLSCCFFFILCFLLTIDKNLNVLWENLKNKAKFRFTKLKSCISERLILVHNYNDFSVDKIENENIKKNKPINFRHSLHYLWRFSIMIIFVIIFYILSTFIFEANVHNNLYYRPQLISIILQRRIKSNHMCFFTLETELKPTNLSLLSIYPEFNSINPPGDALISVIKFLSFSQTQIIKSNLQKIMSSTLKNIILKGDPNNPTFLLLGSIRGLAYLLQESIFISFNGKQDDPSVFSKLVANVIEYTNIGKIATKMSNEDSKTIIENLLSQLLNFNIICCIFMLLGYMLYYYPFLNFEIKMLSKITRVLKILNI